jgi:hypothetical protein
MTTSDDRPLTTADLVAQEPAEPDGPNARAHDAEGSRAGARSEKLEPLLGQPDADRFRDRWHHIQTGFVDEPRRAVESADALVAELMQLLAKGFADERSTLESRWDSEGDVDTEDLRVALQRYRSFFERLLAV